MKILIVEDNYYFVKKILDAITSDDETGESDGLLITQTADPAVANTLLKRRWDWILMDHDLPNRGVGWALLNNTREFREKDNAKIIAISSIPQHNVSLMDHGAQYKVDKMDGLFGDKIKGLIYEQK